MRVTTEKVLAPGDVEPLYALYLAALNPLLTQAAARHVLTPGEFAAEMRDPRIDKIVARDDDGALVALTTITTDLRAIPWVNPVYYSERFPDVVARGAMFYLGYVLVDPAKRLSNALPLMADLVNGWLSSVEGVIAFDICAFNDAYGVGRRTAQMLHRARAVLRLDTQTYYAADFRPADDSGGRAGAGADEAQPPGPLRAHTLAQRVDLADQIPALLDQLRGRAARGVGNDLDGDVAAVLARVPEAQVVLLEDTGRLRGAALWLPLDWDGTVEDLPRDWDEALRRGSGGAGGPRAAVVALPLSPDAEAAAAVYTAPLVSALRRAAAAVPGPTTMLVPVRPAEKRRYPLIRNEEYVAWEADGGPLDPAVRLHTSLGGRIAGTGDGPTATAGRERWAQVLSMPLPGDGTYTFEGGLAPLVVEHGTGRYREPRVWMAHDIGSVDPTSLDDLLLTAPTAR